MEHARIDEEGPRPSVHRLVKSLKVLLSYHLVGHRGEELAGLVVLAAALDLTAAVGLSYVAGFGAVRGVIAHLDPVWLVAVAGGLVISFAGYALAYREISRGEDGPLLSSRQMLAVVTAGFGGFLAHSGSGLDRYVLEGVGSDRKDVSVRVSALAGLEHAALGLIGCVAAIVVLLRAGAGPPLSFLLPWAVLPLPCLLVGFWVARRLRGRLEGRPGTFLLSVELVRRLFWPPRARGTGGMGMSIFWLAELFAAWAGLAACGFRMDGATFIVGFSTGAVFTRRTGPLAGSGILMLLLPVTIWYSGAPLSIAVVGIFAFRLVSLWLPLPFALACLPILRSIGRPECTLPARPIAGPEASVAEPAVEASSVAEPAVEASFDASAAVPGAVDRPGGIGPSR